MSARARVRRARVAGFALVFLALLAVCGPRHSDAAIRKLRIAESAAAGAPALLSALGECGPL